MNPPELLDDDSTQTFLSTGADPTQPTKTTKHRNILVIEDDEVDFKLIRRTLDSASDVSFTVEHAVRLSDGIQRLAEGGIHLVLLDLGLPDCQGMETFRQAYAHSPNVPFIVLSGQDDQSVAIDAVRQGAQDYLIRGQQSELLLRSIGYARARHKYQARLTLALQSVKSSEERFRSITETANDAIVLADETSTIVSWNPAAQTVFGYSADEAIGEPLSVLMPKRYRQSHTRGFQRFQSTGHSDVIGRTVELEGLRKDGTEFPLELSLSSWTTTEGRFHCGTIRDITERKLAEQEHDKRLAAEHDIHIASEVQASLFPSQVPSISGFDIAGKVFSADETSGDYFDFVPMPNEILGVVVGDVSGHGLGPAMMMVQTRAYLRALMREHHDLDDILTRTNQLLLPSDTARFVTLFLGALEPRTRSFTFASAGQRGFLMNANGEVTVLESTGTVLGVLSNATFPCGPEIGLRPGDLILLPTDGIQESQAPDKQLFSEKQMLKLTYANREKPAKEIIDVLHQAVCGWARDRAQADDVTAVVIKVDDEPDAE